jgi:hypothetical protein
MSLPKSRTELRGILTLAKALRVARPFLGMVGIKLEAKPLEEVIRIGQSLLTLAEEFNPVLAPRGWIACNAINTEAAHEALAAAKAGRLDDADEILAKAYSPNVVRVHVRQLSHIRCFARRTRLAMLAVDDYEAGRFHACIPVALALLDGMGQELTGANFFRNTRRIKASDSFLEIGPGVAQLLQVLSETRSATRTDPLSIPFRHGILHGTDLGYDNHVVAAKAWAALLAVGHYATDYLAPPSTPRPSLMETLRRSAETRKRLDEMEVAATRWTARTPDELAALIAREDFVADTPEGTTFAVLDAWQRKKFGLIAKASYDSLKANSDSLAGRIRRTFGPAPDSIKLLAIEDVASAAASITASLAWGEQTDEITLRLVYYVDENVAPRTAPGGRWLVNSLWPLESARAISLDNSDDEPG